MRYKKLSSCPFCETDFKGNKNSANHVRWCKENPTRSEYVAKLAEVRSRRTQESIEKQRESLKKAYINGKYNHLDYSWNIGRSHSEETKERLRNKALASKHRRLVRSVRDYIKTDGTIVKLDSSWEEELAKRLDLLNIEWIRPSEPIPWTDKEGKTHNYFPDFYLPKYDLFLDPKNSYAIASQKEKLEILSEQLKNLIIIKSLEDCKTFSI